MPRPATWVSLALAMLAASALARTGVAATMPGETALSTKVQKLVVLMLENRSFDHMLGFLWRNGSSIDGLVGNETNPWSVVDRSLGSVRVNDSAPLVTPFDPCHLFNCVNEQLFGDALADHGKEALDGFVANGKVFGGHAASTVMNMFTPETVPVLSTLALEFAVFDRYFSSVPADTNPNRRFLHCATAQGALGAPDYNPIGFDCETTFDRLWSVNKTWRIYYSDWSPACDLSSLRTPQARANFFPLEQFAVDAASGELADYSFIEPRMFSTAATPASDQHPPHNVAEGEQLIKEIYEALRGSVWWSKSALIVTYDEHGGFYDHVPPPTAHVPSPDGIDSLIPPFGFDRLGLRVPMVVVSPWVARGTVVSEPDPALMPTPFSQFEHSSIPATMRKIFGWEAFLTRRDAWAATFENVFALDTPRLDCLESLPEIETVTAERVAEQAALPLNDLQREFFKQINTCYPPASPVLPPEAFASQDEGAAYLRQIFKAFLSAP
eukprot:a676768_16.p1 GENE.a676768_16~~a676768_16.p1  ORF type:complete len:507 (+),score=160.49 a676768_16:31-1521(+)